MYGMLKNELIKAGVDLIDTYGVISSFQVNTLAHLDVEYKWSKFSPTWITELLEVERAKAEVRDILTRMIGAEINYVRLGYWVGPAPMGFQNKKEETRHGKRVILEQHSVESKWMIRMFELRMEGVMTDQQIVDELNTMGFKSRIKRVRRDNKTIK